MKELIARLTKISGNKLSHIQPGYIVEGPLVSKIEKGSRVILEGYISTSKMEPFSWFHTTEVQELSDHPRGKIVKTKNSEWLVEIL